MNLMGNISDTAREAATGIVRRAITSGKAHPLSLDVARRFHDHGYVDSLLCPRCSRPVLDDPELGYPHLHTFTPDCAPREAPA
jgi:hypothetical protein